MAYKTWGQAALTAPRIRLALDQSPEIWIWPKKTNSGTDLALPRADIQFDFDQLHRISTDHNSEAAGFNYAAHVAI